MLIYLAFLFVCIAKRWMHHWSKLVCSVYSCYLEISYSFSSFLKVESTSKCLLLPGQWMLRYTSLVLSCFDSEACAELGKPSFTHSNGEGTPSGGGASVATSCLAPPNFCKHGRLSSEPRFKKLLLLRGN
jgi:hypothetical protein